MSSHNPTPSPTRWSHKGWTWRGLWYAQPNNVRRVVVAFHGFGRPVEEMACYLPLYPEGTAMLSVGLCHHNGSTPPGDIESWVLSPDLFQEALTSWLDSLLPPGDASPSRALLGYSLGGRIALTLFERHPMCWDGMLLLAPDGLRKNPLYRFAVETKLGRMMWAWTDRHAETVRALIRGLRRVRVIPAHLEHFALHHTENQATRQLVARTWKTHRAFWPTPESTFAVWQTLPTRNIHIAAVFGSRDAIIPWSWSRLWRTQANSHVHFLQVESGHVMRHPDTVLAIRRTILEAFDETT